ncbi:hypothetical protein [Sphingopyxis sp. JAI108]|uniref:hypothetical protein n=1 Tax=Sphingopyxis sp. JAI108 TaxID=2723060 RepID=UPI0015C765E3|nr:hypothetical protein [Sphingopyxis sp. JAI108]NYF30954.1 hypothetical protein [Sphingopyxis sp. JAI108]
MMARRVDAPRGAPPLRFLLLCVGGWTALRIMMVWNPAMSVPRDAMPARWAPPSPFAEGGRLPERPAPSVGALGVAAMPGRASASADLAVRPSFAAEFEAAGEPPADDLGADRHSLRFALMARLLPPRPGGVVRSAVGSHETQWFPFSPAARADPGQGEPFWIRRQLSGWSLGGWLYLRDGSGGTPDALGAASQLGGSQARLRLAYGFGETGRVRAYGRATVAVQRPAQREVAFGLALAPLANLPVDVAIEQRVAAGREGRSALAVMAGGGVSDVALPAGFRLDAYAQAGVVGARRRDGFADGAILVDRRLGAGETSLRLGALAAGAVQPGAARVDVGPRLTLRLPDVGEGSRIALDWRQRVAGDARPESGLALTLAADF